MPISSVRSNIFRMRLDGCCQTFDPETCKCPDCGEPLKRVMHDGKWTKLQCTKCTFEHVCGDVGKANELNPPAPSFP